MIDIIPVTQDRSGVLITLESNKSSNPTHKYQLKLIETRRGMLVEGRDKTNDFIIFPDEIDRLIAGLKKARKELVLLSL